MPPYREIGRRIEGSARCSGGVLDVRRREAHISRGGAVIRKRLLIVLLIAASLALTGLALHARFTGDELAPPVAHTALTAAPTSDVPTFEEHVRPLLKAYCWDCHGGEGHKADLDMRTLPLILHHRSEKPLLVSGRADKSLLYQRLAAGTMPPPYAPDQPSDEEIAVIGRWINSGMASQQSELDIPEAEPPEWSDDDRNWWAFIPPVRSELPVVQQQDRVRTPVDAFVLARLEEQGLGFAADAERITLLRRVYFDLIGLPPEPAEIQAFVSDSSPDAYERLVDRLLASPHYGERWGRHWLDAAGYADTGDDDHEADKIIARESIWRYRDYVVDSFNADLPYDRFLLEQIAGDEMVDWRSPPVTPEKLRMLIATGFLRQAADVTDEVPRNTAASRHQVLYDTVEVFSSNVLGLTVHCAQCHDHKYDPISQVDYFRLVGTFRPAYNPQEWRTPTLRKMQLERVDQPPMIVQALWDVSRSSETFLYTRGNFQSPSRIVRPGVLSVLDDVQPSSPFPDPDREETSSGYRTALARWLTKPDHPLTARVIVNRVWQELFGKGIVDTPANFGRSGSLPTHPELLDWLASEFVESGWSFKKLHKLLVTSTVYRQATFISAQDPGVREGEDGREADPLTVDPENRLLWRMPLRRLDSEIVRDSVLAVSGRLNEALGGPPVPVLFHPDGSVTIDTENTSTAGEANRRSVYLLARRNYPLSELAVFDQPVAEKNCVRRSNSAVVSQSLTMLNGEFALDAADDFAARVVQTAGDDADQRVVTAFRLAVQREPTSQELEMSRKLLASQAEKYQHTGQSAPGAAADAALSNLCHMLFNTSEFLYVE